MLAQARGTAAGVPSRTGASAAAIAPPTIGVAVGVGVRVAVAVGVGVGVASGVGVGVGAGASSSTTTVPIISGWAEQTNAYVPSVVKVQCPAQPAGWMKAGSGGAAVIIPTVCVHVAGWLAPKTTLWTLAPVG